jgi:hypothetical protein
VIAAALITVAVALSRLYLQVHFPSDVAVGMIARRDLGSRVAALAQRTHMRNTFLGTGEPGYRPLRKLRTVFSGLR